MALASPFIIVKLFSLESSLSVIFFLKALAIIGLFSDKPLESETA